MLISDLDEPACAMVVGASKGIGLALSKSLAANAQVSNLILMSRNACEAEELKILKTMHPEKITILDCDTTNEESLNAASLAIKSVTTSLHLVINTVGLLHDGDLQPEKALTQVTLERLQKSFTANAFSSILLAQAFLPYMKHKQPVVFATLSARVGSIRDNRSGGWYSYRAAKAAQNQLMKTLSIELARLNAKSIVLSLHPGTTDTALSKPFNRNVPADKLFTPEFVASALLKIIAEKQPQDTGSFYAWDGQTIEW
jgi:NAD(P)-dependent dehydrogenase (short-subunit alcohol dehydrogenase family)